MLFLEQCTKLESIERFTQSDEGLSKRRMCRRYMQDHKPKASLRLGGITSLELVSIFSMPCSANASAEPDRRQRLAAADAGTSMQLNVICSIGDHFQLKCKNQEMQLLGQLPLRFLWRQC